MVFAAQFAMIGRVSARMLVIGRCRYTDGVNASESPTCSGRARKSGEEASYGYAAKRQLASIGEVDVSISCDCHNRVPKAGIPKVF